MPPPTLAGYTGIRVLGLQQAARNLATLSDKLQNSIVRQAARQAVNVMARQVKSTTYGGDRHQRTGLLLKSQTVSTRVTGGEVSARVKMRDVNIASNSKIARAVRSRRSFSKGKPPDKFRAFYWWFLEHGTKTRRTSHGADRGAVGARPWVVPAFDAKVGAALDAFQKTLTDRLDEESRKLPLTTGV